MKKIIAISMALFAFAYGAFAAATSGTWKGHEAVQLWKGGPYWATMNCGATTTTAAGYYYLNNTDTKGNYVKDGKLTGQLIANTTTTLWGNGWRMPTTAEAQAMKDYCKVLRNATDSNGQPYVVVGSSTGYTDKTLDFALSGEVNGSWISGASNWGNYGKYWTSDPNIALRLAFSKTSITLGNGGAVGHNNNFTVRLVTDQIETVEPHTHVWNTPTYTWSSDNKTCTASASCTRTGCTETTKTTVTAVYDVVKEPSETETGLATYTATFTTDPFTAVKTKQVTLPKKGAPDPTPTPGPVVADYYVSPTGDDSNAGTSREKPFLTIEHAVAVASAGESICVMKGTYNVEAEAKDYANGAAITLSKAIKVIGDTGNPADVVVHNTKAWDDNANYNKCYRVFTLNHEGAVLSGLTVENGIARGSMSDPKFYGANVFIDTDGGTVTNCIIRNGHIDSIHHAGWDPSDKGGGIIACFSTKGLITHCVITNNIESMGRTSPTQTTHRGGTIVFLQAGTLRQSFIAYNTITESWTGSAVYAEEPAGAETIVENCTIVGNKYVVGPVYGNYSDSGELYPVWVPLMTYDGSSRVPEIRNCFIYGNKTHSGKKLIEWTRYNDAQYSKAKAAVAANFVNCATDMELPSGMTAVTSGFTFTDAYVPTFGSSLIDAGATMKSTVARDLNGITRVKGSAVDIGCYEYPDGEEPIIHTHTWGEPTYEWVKTPEGYDCVASASCTGVGCTETKTERATASYEETKPPTTTETGTGVYTAVFKDKDFKTQTKDYVVPMIHDHVCVEVFYKWADDCSECYASAMCTICLEEIIERGAITAVTNAPTCHDVGSATYTAEFTSMPTTQKTVELPALGHGWMTPEYKWEKIEEDWFCAASSVCSNDVSHVTNETVKASREVLQEATETHDGLALYTAVFTITRFTLQTKQVVLPKTGTGGGGGGGGGEAGGHEGVQLWEGGPYWATMNCGATKVGQAGSYYFNWDDKIGYSVSGGGLTGKLVKNSSTTFWDGGWRKPTEAEAKAVAQYCTIDGTQSFDGLLCVKVRGTTTGYTDKYVWFPLAGWGNGGGTGTGNGLGTFGKYWSEGSGSTTLQHLLLTSGSIGTGPGGANHNNYYTLRLVIDSIGPAHEHAWGTPTYTWKLYDDGNYTCSGNVSCLSNSAHTVSQTVTATYKCLQPATATAEGTGLYIATFTTEPFGLQTKQVIIPIGGGEGGPKKPGPGPGPTPGPTPTPDPSELYTITNITRKVDLTDEYNDILCAYRSLDEAILDANPNDVLVVYGSTTLTNIVTVSDDLTNLTIRASEDSAAEGAVVSCLKGTSIAISSGCRVLFENIVFGIEEGSVFDIQYGGVAAFSGITGGMGAIKTTTEDGFELAGPITLAGDQESLLIDCAATTAGGKFGTCTDPSAKLFADLLKNANDDSLETDVLDDGSLVWLEPYVAQKSEGGVTTKYRSLDALFATVTNDCQIKVIRNCPATCFTNAVTITNVVEITSEDKDGQRCTITPASTVSIYINAGGKLSFKEIRIADYTGPGLFRVNEGGEMTLKREAWLLNLTSSYKDQVYGPLAVLGGTLNMEADSLIEGCKTANAKNSYGGGIYAEKGTVNLLGGTITNCTASAGGGGVYAAYTKIDEKGTKEYAKVNLGGGLIVRGNTAGTTTKKPDDIRIYKVNESVKIVSALTKSVGVSFNTTSTPGYKEGEVFVTADSEAIAAESAKAFFHDAQADFRAEADGANLKWKNVPDDGQRKPSEDLLARVIDTDGNVKEYATLESLFSHIEGDCTIEFLTDAKIVGNVLFANNITLRTAADAKSQPVTLGREDGADMIVVGGGSTLTITNLTVSGACEGYGGRLIHVDGSELVLQSGAAVCDVNGDNSRADSGIVVDLGGHLVMESGSMVYGCSNMYYRTMSDYSVGAGVLLERGSTADLRGGDIFNCYAFKCGGLAVCNGSTIDVSGDFSCHENYSGAFNEFGDIMVEESGELYLVDELESPQFVGRSWGVVGPSTDTNLVGRVELWKEWEFATLTNSAAQFRNNRNKNIDVGVVITNETDEAKIVWNSAINEDGSYTDVEGTVWGVLGSAYVPPTPGPEYIVITNTPTAFAFTMISNDLPNCTVVFGDLVKDAHYSVYTVKSLTPGFDADGLEPITNFNAEADGPFSMTIETTESALFWKAIGETTYVTNYLDKAE